MTSPNPDHRFNQLRRRPRIPPRLPIPVDLPRRSTDSIIPSSSSPQQFPIILNPRPPSITPRPLSFDGDERYVDEAFPWNRHILDTFRYRHRYSFSAPDITSKDSLSFHAQLSTPTYYPRLSSPLTSPPLPPDPVPHVPVPYPPKTELASSSAASAESTLTLALECNVTDVVLTRNKLKKKRRVRNYEEECPKMFAQIGAFFTRKRKPRPDEYPTPNRLVLDCHFIAKYIPPSLDDGVLDHRRRY